MSSCMLRRDISCRFIIIIIINSLGGCSKAPSVLTTVPSEEKEKKLVRIK